MKKTLLVVLFVLTLLSVLYLQNRSLSSQKIPTKSKAAEPSIEIWDKKDAANYLELTVDYLDTQKDKAIVEEHPTWKLNSFQFDLRDPDYRLYWLKEAKKKLSESGKKGLVLSGLFECPHLSSLICHEWRETAVKDFAAQIRQTLSNNTILYLTPVEIKKEQKALFAHFLLQFDGVMVKAAQKEELRNLFQGYVPGGVLSRKIMVVR